MSFEKQALMRAETMRCRCYVSLYPSYKYGEASEAWRAWELEVGAAHRRVSSALSKVDPHLVTMKAHDLRRRATNLEWAVFFAEFHGGIGKVDQRMREALVVEGMAPLKIRTQREVAEEEIRNIRHVLEAFASDRNGGTPVTKEAGVDLAMIERALTSARLDYNENFHEIAP